MKLKNRTIFVSYAILWRSLSSRLRLSIYCVFIFAALVALVDGVALSSVVPVVGIILKPEIINNNLILE